MFEILEKLRAKPDAAKKRFAFLTALSFAGIIFVIWLSIIYPDFQKTETQKKVEEKKISPISGFTDTVSSGFSALSEQFLSLKASISSFSTSPIYYSATSSESSTSTKEQMLQ
jgi:hypothetical protein